MFRQQSTVLLVVCFGLASALYGPKSDVISLTSKNFDKMVMNSNDVWLVEFYAPWCGHCKNLVPVWEQAAKKLKGIVKVAAVDADADRQLGSRFGIQGFPTIKTFASPLAVAKPKKTKTAVDYQGGRTAKAIIGHATSLLPTRHIAKLKTKDDLDAFLANDNHLAKAVLLSEKATPPPMFTALTIQLHNKLSFGFGRSGASEVVSELGVSSFPSVLVVNSDGDRTVYEGEMKRDGLFNFLSKFAGESVEGDGDAQDDAEDEPPKGKPKPLFDDSAPAEVVEVTTDALLEEYCATRKNLCLIAFLDPATDAESQESYLATLQQVAEKNKRHYSVVWVDIGKQNEFFQHFNPSDVPCLRVWSKKKGASADVVASLTPDSLNQFLADLLQGKVRTGRMSPPPSLAAANSAASKDEL